MNKIEILIRPPVHGTDTSPTEAALGVVGMVVVVPGRPVEEQVEGADGEGVTGVHIDRLHHTDHEPDEQHQRVDAEADACKG